MLACLLLAAGAGFALPVAAEVRVLPMVNVQQLGMAGEQQLAVGNAETGPWLLLALEANADANLMLDQLAQRQESFHERLVILVQGQASAVQAMQQRYPKLQGVRWLHGDDVRGKLQLNLMPTLYALRARADGRQEIAWQLAGKPKHGNLLQMAMRWLATDKKLAQTMLAKPEQPNSNAK